eukprot:CAMPEP_0170116224 /NCGR_PEP_ID=MMETSP0020_2-20130122/12106_1 /TAXON_ID=98059 /ORGANISM="Dinobryon sp., Strain UTEXLB2267" /LENGTH=55 /DNA_ID=CAMNT_0010344229 /DNA_START=1179 /DNA_END=1346 /DNA_ORIENTATION=-
MPVRVSVPSSPSLPSPTSSSIASAAVSGGVSVSQHHRDDVIPPPIALPTRQEEGL